MKRCKYVAMALAAVLLMCTACSGTKGSGAFELKNGIHFGDTAATIKQKEKLAFNNETGSAVFFEGSVDGTPESVTYLLDKNSGKLTSVVHRSSYSVDDSETKVKSDFDRINRTLTKDYGTPSRHAVDSTFLSYITPELYYQWERSTYFAVAIGASVDEACSYDQWVIRKDDYVVVVEQLLTSMSVSSGRLSMNAGYLSFYAFSYFTNAEYQEFIKK